MQPLVGVIIPCFNQGRYAAECVASVVAQTYANWRAVVVDDASTDGSGALLDALASDRVSIIHLAGNLGRALVRNEAVRRLGAVDYVLNVDCDDRLTPDYVAKLVAALEADPRAGLAYGTLRFFGAPHPTGRPTWPEKAYVEAERYVENVIPGPGVLFRAAALASTDGWHATFTQSSAEDWDIWLQVVEKGWTPLWVRDAIYDYRQHADSFLARSAEETIAIQEINILRHHARGIRESCGVAAYLRPHILPLLAASIRRGRLRRVMSILAPLLRYAPLATLRLLGRHYAQRLRAILSR